jgi:hypothetical protein
MVFAGGGGRGLIEMWSASAYTLLVIIPKVLEVLRLASSHSAQKMDKVLAVRILKSPKSTC